MSSDNIQRQIEFILEHHARFSEDIERLKEVQAQQAESINRLTEATGRLTEATGSLTEGIGSLTEATGTLAEAISSTQSQVESLISEMRDGFNNLILANEVTRDLASKIATLAVQTSERVTTLEQLVSDIDSKR